MLHEHGAHVQVLVEEAAGLGAVRPDPADHGSQVHDDLRTNVIQQLDDITLVRQVLIPQLSRRRDPSAAARAAKRRNDVPAEKSSAAGHQDADGILTTDLPCA